MTLHKIALMSAASLLLICVTARADDPPPAIRNETQASVIDEKIRREAREPEPRPSVEAIIQDETESKSPSDSESAGPDFFVKKIIVEQSPLSSQLEIQKICAEYEGRELTLKDLHELAGKITVKYRTAGYLTTTAYVPEQDIANSSVRIEIVEGKVGSYQVEGNRFFRKSQLIRYLPQKPGEVFKYSELRRGLAKINENPDREARAILRKGQARETTDIIIRVKDKLPLHASLLFDNQGSRPTGQKRYGATLRSSNVTGLDDSFLVGTIFGQRFGSIFTRYDLPILPHYGTSFYTGFSHVQVDPQKELKESGVNGTAETYSTGLRQPLFNNGTLAAGLETGFDFKENRTKVLSGTFRRERLRVLRFAHDISLRDRFGYTRWEQNYSFGLPIFGASIHADPSSSRQGVETDFFKWSGSLSRRVDLFYGVYSQLKTTFQVASTKLASSEGLYMGGASTIRGYPEGDYIADRGIYNNIELLSPVFLIPKSWKVPVLNTLVRDHLELVSFFDFGYGSLKGPSSSEVRARHLAGIGGGVRIRLFRNLYSRLEWASAVGDHPLSGTGHSEFHFRVQAEV